MDYKPAASKDFSTDQYRYLQKPTSLIQDFQTSIQFPRLKEAKAARKTLSVSNKNSTTERSKVNIKDNQMKFNSIANGQHKTIGESDLSQIQELGLQNAYQEKYSLLRINKRPQYNVLSPYIEHITKQIQQKKNYNAQMSTNPRDSATRQSAIDHSSNDDFSSKNEKQDKLKFKTNLVGMQIQRQKQARKYQQYQEDDLFVTSNIITNFNSKSTRKLESLENIRPPQTLADPLDSRKSVEMFQQKLQINDYQSNQLGEINKDSFKLKTIDQRSNFKVKSEKQVLELMKRETMNIIRQKTGNQAIILQKNNTYERAMSVVDQKNKNHRNLLTAAAQVIATNRNIDINIEQIRLNQAQIQNQRNSIARDNVSKSTQMQSVQKLIQGQHQEEAISIKTLTDQNIVKADVAEDKRTQIVLLQQQIGVVSTSLAIKSKYLIFQPFTKDLNDPEIHISDKGYYFKFFNPLTDIKLVRFTLEDNGFMEYSTTNSSTNKSFSQQTQYGNTNKNQYKKDGWTVMWSCQIMKSNVFQSMTKYQKINHFPRSFELTRKDFMNERIARMVSIHGKRNFNFTPSTFVLPKEMDLLQKEMEENRRQWWIVKPAASAQGKGIFITNDIREIQAKQSLVASHYLDNPLLINGLKFDLRIYVAITSINPLRIYMFEEGLTRFATCQYQTVHSETKSNRFMHLTNYSINKMNKKAFVQNNDTQNTEGYGSKWSLAALKKELRKMGIDEHKIFKRIEDIVIKTIISAEPILNNAFEMFVPYRNSCFELLGFDILVDDHLNPWLLEVNMSPSLACDSALDQQIKSNLISDLLNLAGIVNSDFRKITSDVSTKIKNGFSKGSAEYQPQILGLKQSKKQQKIESSQPFKPSFDISFSGYNTVTNQSQFERNKLKGKERAIVKESEEEFQRKGAFKLIFPNESYGYYKQFFEEDRPLNALLEKQFREMHLIENQRNQQQQLN